MPQDLLVCRPCKRNFRVEKGVHYCPQCGLLSSVWECNPVPDDESPVDLGAVLDDLRDALSDGKKDAGE
ncbi:MAG TPA: hypothetical protein VIF34_08245 [Methylocystis sp.]|jgi:hypothetical protein